MTRLIPIDKKRKCIVVSNVAGEVRLSQEDNMELRTIKFDERDTPCFIREVAKECGLRIPAIKRRSPGGCSGD